MTHWRFLDSWQKFLPWREEKHLGLTLSTDASGYGWGCVVHLPSGDQTISDYWDEQHRDLNISNKEMFALVNAKRLFYVLSDRNFPFILFHVKSSDNQADGPSRRLSKSDSKLSARAWALVKQSVGGTCGHSFDLMALDSNAVIGLDGSPLPHFTPFFFKSTFARCQFIFSRFVCNAQYV